MEDILCPACENSNCFQTFKKKNVPEEIKMHASGFSRGNRDLFKCIGCELIFCYPMPSDENLAESYAIEADFEFVSQNPSRISTFRKHLIWLQSVMPFYSGSDQILDIGSAAGAFLEAARLQNMPSLGLEINPWLVNWGSNNYEIDLKVGKVESILESHKKYKAISLWDVLEHLPKPQNSLSIITSKIEKDGYLILSLPNTDSISFKIMRWAWPMHLDVHLLYFNSKSIQQIMDLYNFKLIEKKINRQSLTIGYVTLRILKQLRILKSDSIFSRYLINGWLSKLNVTYSIGQTIFLFQNRK